MNATVVDSHKLAKLKAYAMTFKDIKEFPMPRTKDEKEKLDKLEKKILKLIRKL